MESLQLTPRLHAIDLKWLVRKKRKNNYTNLLKGTNALHCNQVQIHVLLWDNFNNRYHLLNVFIKPNINFLVNQL